MTPAAGPYLASCVLLVVAGVAKVRQPTPTQAVLRGFVGRGRLAPGWAVRVGGVAEVVLGATAIITSTPSPAFVVALCYVVFAGFVIVSMTRGLSASGCGCFGQTVGDAALGPLHVIVNLALAATALTVAIGGGLDGPAAERVLVLVLAAGLAWVVYLTLVPLPALMTAVRNAGR